MEVDVVEGRTSSGRLRDVAGWLDGLPDFETRGSSEFRPGLERMRALTRLLGDPQDNYPVVLVTGSNGKGSTVSLISRLLTSMGLSVGTYTSPDLGRLNERMTRSGRAIDDQDLFQSLERIAGLEGLLGGPPTRFEALTASAYTWFSDLPVDVAVVEVGMGGRDDPTNVANAAVAVVTNVSLEHTDFLGATREEIAQNKAGISRPGSALIVGEDDPSLLPVFQERPVSELWVRGDDFSVDSDLVAVGGRLLELRTRGASYPDVFLSLHGSHQSENASLALAAAEAFFGTPLPAEVVEDAFREVSVPGRLEVARRSPLCLLDGAHNPAAFEALGAALAEDFAARPVVVVMGVLSGRDPGELLDAMGVRPELVVCCSPRSPRALPAQDVRDAATERGLTARVAESVAEACEDASSACPEGGLVLVTGSLYLVAEARTFFGLSS